MQGVVRHGRNMILPLQVVMLGPHAAPINRRLIPPKFIIVAVAMVSTPSSPQRDQRQRRGLPSPAAAHTASRISLKTTKKIQIPKELALWTTHHTTANANTPQKLLAAICQPLTSSRQYAVRAMRAQQLIQIVTPLILIVAHENAVVLGCKRVSPQRADARRRLRACRKWLRM